MIKNKIFYTHEELLNALISAERPLVFTNGVFDILHKGHVTYLEEARGLGASLLVAVNSDVSTKNLGKGPGRPINKEVDRAAVIASLESVSFVTLFDDVNPCRLIGLVRPEIYVKGGDYNIKVLEEARLMDSLGGKAIALSYIRGYSTTNLVKQIKN